MKYHNKGEQLSELDLIIARTGLYVIPNKKYSVRTRVGISYYNRQNKLLL
jgi:hypothetical protein